ncbi:hypothetical protein TNCV_1571191 [Trichonephila clavipes]|uniref:Mos1 transposase HTH domain-containing protein n=1 Tax=Trichonephila clavipes TaxID=2585209 RepID=A0A8X6VNS2_TRICX|nr:hypothetical protein TNCV_1571191 [Trichonephila clavipes]
MKEQKIVLFYAWQDTERNLFEMLVRVHEDQALSMKCVYEWFTHFRESREIVSDKTRSGRPATSISDENIEKVRKLTKLPNKTPVTNRYPVFRNEKNMRDT